WLKFDVVVQLPSTFLQECTRPGGMFIGEVTGQTRVLPIFGIGFLELALPLICVAQVILRFREFTLNESYIVLLIIGSVVGRLPFSNRPMTIGYNLIKLRHFPLDLPLNYSDTLLHFRRETRRRSF